MTELEKSKAAEARRLRVEAQSQRYREQCESIKVARLALQRIVEAEDATVTQTLKALELVSQLVEHNRF